MSPRSAWPDMAMQIEMRSRKELREIAHKELDAIDATGRKKAELWGAGRGVRGHRRRGARPAIEVEKPCEPRHSSAGLLPEPTGKRR